MRCGSSLVLCFFALFALLSFFAGDNSDNVTKLLKGCYIHNWVLLGGGASMNQLSFLLVGWPSDHQRIIIFKEVFVQYLSSLMTTMMMFFVIISIMTEIIMLRILRNSSAWVYQPSVCYNLSRQQFCVLVHCDNDINAYDYYFYYN